jgi:hypothetical protein
MGTSWGSVRKVRSMAQIMALLEAASKVKSRVAYYETVRNSLIEQHIAYEKSRLRGAQASYRPLGSIRAGLKSLTRDNMSFLKKTGLVKVTDDRIQLPRNSRALLTLWRKRELKELKKRVLRLVLTSEYHAYMEFLLNLQRLAGKITLPGGGEQRYDFMRETLHEFGFETDVASFYTIRDLFHDFGLINYAIEKRTKSETIFLTSRIGDSAKSSTYQTSVQIESRYLQYDRKLTAAGFCRALVDAYRASSETWGRWARLLDLRDHACVTLRISDDVFNSLITTILKRGRCNGFKFEGSTGYRVGKRSYGVLSKSVRMPLLEGGQPVLYVAVSRL